ncbi:ABC transporter ATP-binding protein [Cryptosporangium arvum]|uniref:ABC-type multidrug transport system, ATPase and permease component n=1 Tax=Cryptosporangium arvum DSM 44712 TaxID=927661 RepID=A0A010ZTU8_9ACTN|nr:ABC transporter ATP-binding protein [Cryptosporangium arvum]EXG82129.1 ABC-type multidrug transport system, ATPase and permease component [Cryptosporangium arvum DSM 44712]
MLIRLLRSYSRPYRRHLVVLVVLQLGQVAGSLLLPTLNAAVVDNGLIKGDPGYIRRLGVVMVLVAIGQLACAAGAAYLGPTVAMSIGRDLRAAVFHRVLSYSGREVARFGAPSLIARTVNDVQQVQTLVELAAGAAVTAPIMCVGAVVLAFGQDSALALMVLGFVLVIGVVVVVSLRRLSRLHDLLQAGVDRLNRMLRDQITGVRVIRAYRRDQHELSSFERANHDLADVSLRVWRLVAVMYPVILIVTTGFTVALLWFGALRIDDGLMAPGTLTAFLGYLVLVLVSVIMATLMFLSAPRAHVCAERITEVLETHASVVAPAHPRTPAPTASRGAVLELRGVGFRYPAAARPALHGVDLCAAPGETVAVLGRTGSGKSTLLGLAPRQYDATAGAVLLDGVDVRELEPSAVAAAVGLVPQRPYLFAGTVASNLRFGNPKATADDMWRALEIAQVLAEVERLPLGLDAPVSQGGANFSGGQRQRLGIARTLLHRPRVYLFDDCFSALDNTTNEALQDALAPHLHGATVILVTQQVGRVSRADRIVMLEQGRAVGTGTHHELMRDCAPYRELALSQLTAQVAR